MPTNVVRTRLMHSCKTGPERTENGSQMPPANRGKMQKNLLRILQDVRDTLQKASDTSQARVPLTPKQRKQRKMTTSATSAGSVPGPTGKPGQMYFDGPRWRTDIRPQLRPRAGPPSRRLRRMEPRGRTTLIAAPLP